MLAQFSQLLDIPWFIKCEGSVVEPPRSRKLIADRQRPNDRQRHTNDRRLACQIIRCLDNFTPRPILITTCKGTADAVRRLSHRPTNSRYENYALPKCS
jgi:hypothetical protein